MRFHRLLLCALLTIASIGAHSESTSTEDTSTEAAQTCVCESKGSNLTAQTREADTDEVSVKSGGENRNWFDKVLDFIDKFSSKVSLSVHDRDYDVESNLNPNLGRPSTDSWSNNGGIGRGEGRGSWSYETSGAPITLPPFGSSVSRDGFNDSSNPSIFFNGSDQASQNNSFFQQQTGRSFTDNMGMGSNLSGPRIL